MEVELGRQLAAGGRFECGVGLQDDVVAISGYRQPVGDEGGVLGGGRLDKVVERDRLHVRADLVESIGAPLDDFEVEVELGARGQRDPQLPLGRRFARYLAARSW